MFVLVTKCTHTSVKLKVVDASLEQIFKVDERINFKILPISGRIMCFRIKYVTLSRETQCFRFNVK